MFRRSTLIPVTVFAVMAAAIWSRYLVIHQQHEHTLEAETAIMTERLAAQLDQYVGSRLGLIELLAAEWDERVDSQDAFAAIAAHRMRVLPGCQAINWIDDGNVIRWVYPIEGNEGALNADLDDRPRAAPTLAAARAAMETRVTAPIGLLQGGRGIAAYIPIPPGPDGAPRGTLNVVLRMDHVLEASLGGDLSTRFDWRAEDVEQSRTPPRGGAAFAHTVGFRVGNRPWTLTVAPTPALLAAHPSTSDVFVVWAAAATAVLLAVLLWRWMVSRETALAMSRHVHAMVRAYPDIQARMRLDGTIVELMHGAGANVVALAESGPDRRTWDFMSPEGAAALEAAMRAARADGLGEATYARDRDDQREYFEARAVPLEGEEFLVIIRDISERLRARGVERSRNAVFEMLSRDAPLDAVMERLVLLIEEVAPDCIGSVLLLDESGTRLRHCAAPNLPEDYCAAIDGVEIGCTVGSCGAAAATGERVVVDDVLTHPNWTPYRAIIEPTGLHACWSNPIKQADGTVLGTFAMYYRMVREPSELEIELIETAASIACVAIERSRGRDELRQRERHLAETQRAARLGSWEWRPQTGLNWSPEYADLLGLEDGETISAERYLDRVHPDDVDELRACFNEADEREVPFAIDHRIVLNGHVMHVHAVGHPEHDADGTLCRWHGHVQDITERKETEARLRLLMAELDHRVKNMLAAVLALTEQSAIGMKSVPEFTRSLTGRIRSLAATHAALSATQWTGAELSEMLHLTLDAFSETRVNRITLDGPPCRLDAGVTPAVCMTLHELATNAAKYGALSVPRGRVVIQWSIADDCLELEWRETDGPAVETPTKRGFGTRLMQGLIEHDLRGSVQLDFEPNGLVCRFRIPIGTPSSRRAVFPLRRRRGHGPRP